MADAVGVQLGNGLEDAFRTIGFSGMNRLFHEIPVNEVIGPFEVDGRVTRFVACQVKSYDGYPGFISDFHRGPGQFHGRHLKNLLPAGKPVDVVNPFIVIGVSRFKFTQGTHNNSKGIRGFFTVPDSVISVVIIVGGSFQALVDRC